MRFAAGHATAAAAAAWPPVYHHRNGNSGDISVERIFWFSCPSDCNNSEPMNTGINAINEAVQEAGAFSRPLFNEIGKVIVGQAYLVERLVIGLLANGHVLLEGVPGLAKTLSVKSLANCLNVKFSRLQFPPDMLPADVVGTQIYNPQSGGFTTRKGPVFANLVLADEINRAPAKVQSALLEAMQEKQVTIGDQTWKLDEPFLVLATQNPIEQEGTYPLPEAQVDRFMLKLKIGYPSRAEERQILEVMAKTSGTPTCSAVVTPVTSTFPLGSNVAV